MQQKTRLQKAIALSLLLTGFTAAPVWAAENGKPINETVAVTDSIFNEYGVKEIEGNAGAAGDAADSNGGNGGAVTITFTANTDVTIADAELMVYGGYGGDGNISSGGNGGEGGMAIGSMTIDDTAVQYHGLEFEVYGDNGGDGRGNNAKGGAGGFGQNGLTLSGADYSGDETVIRAGGGNGGELSSSSSGYSGGSSGAGGNALTSGITLGASVPGGRGSTVTAAKVQIVSLGGDGGTSYNTGSAAGSGGAAVAYGIQSRQLKLPAQVNTVILTGSDADDTFLVGAVGGTGGEGGKKNTTGGNGGEAAAYGVYSNGSLEMTVGTINVVSMGGDGGDGGSENSKGGNGGSAKAYGVYGYNNKATLTVDAIKVSASGGVAGEASNHIGGTDGKKGAEASAYGVYASTGTTVQLHEKTAGAGITITTEATQALQTSAYDVYAENGGTVLFYDNAVFTNNDSSTYLNNAVLGFGNDKATTVGRSVTGGVLQLEGSNEFRVATDLAQNKADSFTFSKLAADSSTAAQYITVGYEKAFADGSGVNSVSGSATVLKVTDLNGQSLADFTGKKSTLDSPLERFTAMPTIEVNDTEVKITKIELSSAFDPSETAMNASDAQMAASNMWRLEGNNLMKRMGDLRSDPEAAQGGVWARYYRGELSVDSAYDRSFDQDYTAFQGGIDKVQDYKGGKLYTGIAVNRIDSKAGYSNGSGELSSTGIGLYASWLGSRGHYLDVIARSSRLTNDFKLVDLSGNAAKADYDTWAYGVSAEYGYRQNLQGGWFVEPQAELSLGHINSADYRTSNDVIIKQDGINSAVTRIGVLGGKEFTIGGRPSNAYIKASLLHDFGSNGGATGYYGSSSLDLQTGDLPGTWYELGLGANLALAKNSNLYFDALKTFGGNVHTDWQINAGLRFTF